jgi:hypothetical protein
VADYSRELLAKYIIELVPCWERDAIRLSPDYLAFLKEQSAADDAMACSVDHGSSF